MVVGSNVPEADATAAVVGSAAASKSALPLRFSPNPAAAAAAAADAAVPDPVPRICDERVMERDVSLSKLEMCADSLALCIRFRYSEMEADGRPPML